jgi:hypothetical protein
MPTRASRAEPECAKNPDAFFPVRYTAESTAEAKELCRKCPGRVRCAERVAGREPDEGVYAAMTPKEREGLAELLAAAGGDMPRVLRLFDDREAFAAGRRIRTHGVTRAVAEQIVGVADLERAQLVRRWAPDLVDRVLSGGLTLRDAAVQASVVADEKAGKVAA